MIKKNDNVIVITGKDKGRSASILRVFPKKDLVMVSGVNLKKKHQRPRKGGERGQVIDKPMPIHVSNVMIVDPETKRPSRVGRRLVGGSFVRISKKSGKEV
ncbi:MAG: 50S ribosomal protein L24 [Candidatus Taylorbacteria bacterium]|nr:50S ribosomal protein L24 [Candidatus Taylorbacteria bacterium]